MTKREREQRDAATKARIRDLPNFLFQQEDDPCGPDVGNARWDPWRVRDRRATRNDEPTGQ